MRRKKEVFLKAYIAANLGDDLFIRDISLRYPNINFYVFSSVKYVKGFSDIENIRIGSGFLFFIHRIIRKITNKAIISTFLEKRKAACVHIGGSIFMEPLNFKRVTTIEQNPNMYVIGANFGPFYTEDYLNYTREKISKMNDICFRDSYSYNMFKELGNVRWTSDVLFGYKYYPKIIRGEGIGISIIDLNYRRDLANMAETYYDTIAKLIDLCNIRNVKVTLFAFCKIENDNRAINDILKRTQSRAKICIYDGNTEKFLDEFNACEYILASRFHAMIIGWVLRKKVFPIIYSSKQLNVMEDVHYTGKSWNLMKKEVYEPERLLQDSSSSITLENIEYYIENAELQYKKFDDYIKNVFYL